MKLNEDGKTVRAMDLLAPGIGEIIGGSQREDNLEALEKRMDEVGLKKEDYSFYLDLRRFGSLPTFRIWTWIRKNDDVYHRYDKYKRRNTIPKNTRKCSILIK